MAPVTRARAKSTDKPQSPLKNILKAPARRAAKSKTTTSIGTNTLSKSTRKGVTKAPPKTTSASSAQSTRGAQTAPKRGKRVKAELEVKEAEEVPNMDVDEIMTDAPSATAVEKPAIGASAAQPVAVPIPQPTPARASKIPKPSPKTSPAFNPQAKATSGGSNKENGLLEHSVSASRLVQPSLHQKSSKEGVMSHSPLKSSMKSLQNVLSGSPKKASHIQAGPPSSPFKALQSFSNANTPAAAHSSAASRRQDDDVFQDNLQPSAMKIFKSPSMPSLNKSCALGSPRKLPKKENFLATSPQRKNGPPRRTPVKSPSASPDRMQASMMPFNDIFPGIPSSPQSSPEHPIFAKLAKSRMASPRKPLAEMGPPTVPARSSSKSPKKHEGEPLASRSPSKMPRLSPSKSNTSLRSTGSTCSSAAGLPTFKIPATPSKSSLRSPQRVNEPALSTKKSVTWNEDVRTSSPRAAPVSNILSDCVFYVDVNTSEGSDASHLFIPLLEELGGQVVPQWTSNGMGVTHVLFKDGDDRTLEKVVASNGAVMCVNVGWAVDCERFNRHLPEEEYVIDLSRIPGMTPTKTPNRQQHAPSRPLSPVPYQLNNALTTPNVPRTPVPRAPTLSINNTMLAITTPSFVTAGSKTVGAVTKTYNIPFNNASAPSGPEEEDKENVFPDKDAPSEKSSLSPSTPYFLHNPQDLVQKSCPPRGSVMLEDAGSPLKQRLLLAKRKSLEFAPKISSPLRLSADREDY